MTGFSLVSPDNGPRLSDRRNVYGCTANSTTRMYRFSEHGGMTIHTHLGRYSHDQSRRILFVTMAVGDIVFTDISRHDAACALWAYRHDDSLTISELRRVGYSRKQDHSQSSTYPYPHVAGDACPFV